MIGVLAWMIWFLTGLSLLTYPNETFLPRTSFLNFFHRVTIQEFGEFRTTYYSEVS